MCHPRSPLFSVPSVQRVFFSADAPLARVRAFFPLLCETEAWAWPMAFLKKNPVDCRNVLRGCAGQLLVVGGGQDLIFDPAQMRRMGCEYEETHGVMVREKKLEVGEGGRAVGVEILDGLAHYVQNDVRWQDAAEVIESWLRRLPRP